MTEANSAKNHRGFGKRIKYALPPAVFNTLRTALNAMVSALPYSLKYGAATALRRRKYPYSVIRTGDITVQAGAPRDLLSAGRSRAIHFARLVGNGTVVIIEPDPGNCDALKRFIKSNALERSIVLVEKGLWSEPGELNFLSSPNHPAANVLVDAKEIDQSLIDDRNYSLLKVPVDTLDKIMLDLDLPEPRLVSLTTNGAEPDIIKGMTNLIDHGLEYVSLASTDSGYPELMAQIGYKMIAIDDRGYTFRKKTR